MNKLYLLVMLFSISISGNSQVTAVCNNTTVYLDNTGSYTIQDSDINGGSTSANMPLTFSATQTAFGCSDIANTYNASGDDLIISGVFDGTLSGGKPKGIELYVINNIPDLSIYGIGSANNGGGSDGQEFTFPVVAVTAGTYIYITNALTEFQTWFGFLGDYASSSMAINGDDAIELFKNSIVIDVFGDINTDGTNQPWEYLDGWAYRNNLTVTNNGSFNDNNWVFSGKNVYDGQTDNASSPTPMPIGTHNSTASTVLPGTLVSLTVTDAMMNTASCVAQVIVLDTLAPTVSCLGGTPTFNLDATTGLFVLTTADIDNASVDNCSAVTLSITNPTFSCADQGLNTIKLYGTDTYGNIDSCSMDIIIDASNVISITSLTTTNPLCNGTADGTIEVVSTGVDTYSIDNNTTSQTTNMFNALTAGNYHFMVTSTDGCTDTMSTTIINPLKMTASFVVVNETCINANNGEIDITVLNAVGTPTFDWGSAGTTEDLSTLTSGTYTVTILDDNNCTITADTLLVAPIEMTAYFVVINEICLKDSIGEIDMTVTGGTGNYTYTWDNSLGSTTEDLTNLPGGTYTVIITDDNACTITADTMIATGVDIDLTVSLTDYTISSPYTFATSYQWINCSDNSVVGTNNYEYTATDNGSYALIITSIGCIDTTECTTIAGLSVNENYSSMFNIYPNPSNGAISVELSTINNLISIIDINGKIVKTIRTTKNQSNIDLNHFENGIYFVKVETKNGIITKKISLIK